MEDSPHIFTTEEDQDLDNVTREATIGQMTRFDPLEQVRGARKTLVNTAKEFFGLGFPEGSGLEVDPTNGTIAGVPTLADLHASPITLSLFQAPVSLEGGSTRVGNVVLTILRQDAFASTGETGVLPVTEIMPQNQLESPDTQEFEMPVKELMVAAESTTVFFEWEWVVPTSPNPGRGLELHFRYKRETEGWETGQRVLVAMQQGQEWGELEITGLKENSAYDVQIVPAVNGRNLNEYSVTMTVHTI